MSRSSKEIISAGHYNLSKDSPVLVTSSSRGILRRVLEQDLEANDDEAERLSRQRQNIASNCTSISGNSTHNSSFDLSKLSQLSSTEISNQINQCLKLNVENKISDKNAFQLQMIDFLIYSLKRQDPCMTNLQMASACLDASGKIYGFRVDKVYSDLLKVISAGRGEKRNYEDANEFDVNNNRNRPRKKRKTNRSNILSSVETLKNNLVTYNPLSLINYCRDAQTSDMMFQACLPQHANQGIALNFYNDGILDKLSSNKINSIKISFRIFDNYLNDQLCPSYADFKFQDWSPDDISKEQIDQMEESDDGEYHFNINDPVLENIDELAQSIHQQKYVDNFQDIIMNNSNPNATHEYSYLQQNHHIRWNGPSHWKLIFNKNSEANREVEIYNHSAKRKRKDIELSFTADAKEMSEMKFVQGRTLFKLSANTTNRWQKKKLRNFQGTHFDPCRFYRYSHKPTEHARFSHIEEIRAQPNRDEGENFDIKSDFNISNLSNEVDVNDNIEERLIEEDVETNSHDPAASENQMAFIGDNLVSAPKVIEKVFIPYSQRAKKINMQQLKKAMWSNINKTRDSNKNIESKELSSVYLELSKTLSKDNVESLSPAIAFTTLLHLSHEKKLEIKSQNNFSDIVIKCCNKN